MEDIVAAGPPDLMKRATSDAAFPLSGASKACFGHSPTLRSGQTLMKIIVELWKKITASLAVDGAVHKKVLAMVMTAWPACVFVLIIF